MVAGAGRRRWLGGQRVLIPSPKQNETEEEKTEQTAAMGMGGSMAKAGLAGGSTGGNKWPAVSNGTAQ